MELLAKESSLWRDRQLLAAEVEFLRQQTMISNEPDIDKQHILKSSRYGAIDSILTTVRTEEHSSKQELLDVPQQSQLPSDLDEQL